MVQRYVCAYSVASGAPVRAAQADLPRTAGASVRLKTLACSRACSRPGDNSSNPLRKDLCAVVGELGSIALDALAVPSQHRSQGLISWNRASSTSVKDSKRAHPCQHPRHHRTLHKGCAARAPTPSQQRSITPSQHGAAASPRTPTRRQAHATMTNQMVREARRRRR